MNWFKLVISIVAIAIMESHAPKELQGHTVEAQLFEIALCILFGAWIISKGW